jgi:hypothetical protein
MPRGPKGERRPGDVIGAAIMVGRIATGDFEESEGTEQVREAARKGGLKGGPERAAKLAPGRRAEIAKKAAKARWAAKKSK